ncbi:MAG: hypothetical protein ACM3IJ_05115 [Candidatus Levyibacteriota bacterium]
MAKKKSEVSKSLTTVTTFSKIIALILFALLPLAGFFVGKIYQEKIDAVTSATITPVSSLK